MSKPWDAIVVGAGVGGLCAAARLKRAGLRVLVLERNLHAGGTANVFTRQGFVFPMGPLGFSSPDLVRQTLTALGQDLDFHRVHYEVRAFGKKVPLSLSFGRLMEEMARLFPTDAGGIRQFFDDLDKLLSAMASPDRKDNRKLLEKAAKTSAHTYLGGIIKDWRLRRILGSLGTRKAYTGLPLLSAMWDLMARQGIWYPKGGMGSFCQSLASAATGPSKGNKGFAEIRLGTEVKEIRVQDRRVSGVTLAEGAHIRAAAVISNADYKTTFLRLVKPDALPQGWYGEVTGSKQAGSVFQVSLGVDASKADLSAFSEASRLIYRGTPGRSGETRKGPDWLAAEVDPYALAGQELEVSLWSREDPALAPQGAAVLVLRTEAEHGHFQEYRPAPGRRNPSYHGYKMRLGQALVREASHLIPGLEQAVKVIDVATPLTYEERGGRSEGAVAGWSWDYEDNPDYQPIELIRTPIRGLYMAGYQAYSALFMGGVPMAVASGHRAAEALLHGAGPMDVVKLPGSLAEAGPS
jgi:phytoene dehydrogenase-like protein